MCGAADQQTRRGPVDLAGSDEAVQQDLLDLVASELPLGQVAEPDEIANTAPFPASATAEPGLGAGARRQVNATQSHE
jgi:hypothetical protein